MTKTEQNRVLGWRLKVLREARVTLTRAPTWVILSVIFSRTSHQLSVNQEDTKRERRTLDPPLARTLKSRSVAQVLRTSEAQSVFRVGCGRSPRCLSRPIADDWGIAPSRHPITLLVGDVRSAAHRFSSKRVGSS
jgi:hypothetical protein